MFDGARPAFPFRLLEHEEVAVRTLAAIRQEERFVVIPWRGNIIFLTHLMPLSLQAPIIKMLGVLSSMTDLKGKGTLDKRIPGL